MVMLVIGLDPKMCVVNATFKLTVAQFLRGSRSSFSIVYMGFKLMLENRKRKS